MKCVFCFYIHSHTHKHHSHHSSFIRRNIKPKFACAQHHKLCTRNALHLLLLLLYVVVVLCFCIKSFASLLSRFKNCVVEKQWNWFCTFILKSVWGYFSSVFKCLFFSLYRILYRFIFRYTLNLALNNGRSKHMNTHKECVVNMHAGPSDFFEMLNDRDFPNHFS